MAVTGIGARSAHQGSGRRGRARALLATRVAGRGDAIAAAAYFLLLGLFGGGPVGWTNAYVILCLATLVAATFWAWRDGFASLVTLSLPARAGLAGVALLPLAQLMPLPPALWHALPGQEPRRATLALAGLDGTWQPLSLEPQSTALAAVLAIGFVALTGLLLRVTDAQFRRLLALATALVGAGITVGLLQVVGDGWPFLQVRNMGATMLGFMANKNHMALLIACAILLVGLPVGRDLFGRERRRAVAGGFALFALVCIVTTNSRAGLGLGALAAAIVGADLATGVALRWRLMALAVGATLVVAVVSSDAFETVGTRVGDVNDDLRWSFLQWSWPLVERHWLLGSGFGSFTTLFAANEQLGWVKPTYVNAVHNDWVQLLLEAGLLGVAVLTALAAGVVGRVRTWWETPRRDPRRAEMGAGLAILLLFALHGLLDYPLRRPAAWAFAALALAAVLRPAGTSQGRVGIDPA